MRRRRLNAAAALWLLCTPAPLLPPPPACLRCQGLLLLSGVTLSLSAARSSHGTVCGRAGEWLATSVGPRLLCCLALRHCLRAADTERGCVLPLTRAQSNSNLGLPAGLLALSTGTATHACKTRGTAEMAGRAAQAGPQVEVSASSRRPPRRHACAWRGLPSFQSTLPLTPTRHFQRRSSAATGRVPTATAAGWCFAAAASTERRRRLSTSRLQSLNSTEAGLPLKSR